MLVREFVSYTYDNDMYDEYKTYAHCILHMHRMLTGTKKSIGNHRNEVLDSLFLWDSTDHTTWFAPVVLPFSRQPCLESAMFITFGFFDDNYGIWR